MVRRILLVLILLCAPVQALALELTGELFVSQIENFDTGEFETQYDLLVAETQAHRLFFNAAPPAELKTGMMLSISGDEINDPAYPGAVLVSSYEAYFNTDAFVEAAVTGTRAAIAVRVNFSDANVECSTADIAEDVWTGTQNTNDFYQENSFGQLSFPSDTDGDTNPDVFEVTIANSVSEACTSANYYAWVAAADVALAGLGVDLNLYRHRMYYLPNTTTCTWAGLGNVGCGSYCRSWMRLCNSYIDVVGHELGHNLGMSHASTDPDNDGSYNCEYCDTSGTMGYATNGWRHFNSVHKMQMGWIPAGRYQELTEDGSYSLGLLEQVPSTASPASPTDMQVAKMAVPSSTDYYYLSYRVQAGDHSTGLPAAYRNELSIHRRQDDTSSRSLFITSLGDGESWDDGNGVSVSVDSVAASSINYSVSGLTDAPTPTPTPTPDPGPGAGPDPDPSETSNVVVQFNTRNSQTLRVFLRKILRGRAVATAAGSVSSYVSDISPDSLSATMEVQNGSYSFSGRGGRYLRFIPETADISDDSAVTVSVGFKRRLWLRRRRARSRGR